MNPISTRALSTFRDIQTNVIDIVLILISFAPLLWRGLRWTIQCRPCCKLLKRRGPPVQKRITGDTSQTHSWLHKPNSIAHKNTDNRRQIRYTWLTYNFVNVDIHFPSDVYYAGLARVFHLSHPHVPQILPEFWLLGDRVVPGPQEQGNFFLRELRVLSVRLSCQPWPQGVVLEHGLCLNTFAIFFANGDREKGMGGGEESNRLFSQREFSFVRQLATIALKLHSAHVEAVQLALNSSCILSNSKSS